MKKIICLITITLMGVVAFAQTVTLTFTGRDAAEHWIQLNRVVITNLTKSWQETIYWPDTTLTMQNGTGIDESVANGGFVLSQNNPNPFTGTTDVNLTVADAGAVTLKIVDGNGKIVETRHGTSLQPGTHQFRISLNAAGTYVMTARQNGKSSSIKMVCNGGGNANGIDYLGMVQTITFVLKSTTNNPFNFGDMMEYVGYATINGTEVESQRITQAQGTSQTFVLQFDATQLYVPVVSTDAISGVTTATATCGGNVTYDGGASVIARGVCWSTSSNPTTSTSHTTDGSGMGSFTSSLTGLLAGTTYYVRAYATNSVGTAYGEERVFTTLCDLPEVTTTNPSNISSTTFTCGGDVIAINCDELTARGVCWNTTGNPTIADNHTTEGTVAGNFTSSVTGVECSTTYYVRAYATNVVGTSYGEEYEVATLAPTLPDVATSSATLYNVMSIVVSSDVTSENCEAVSSRGICYSTSPNPTINDLHTTHAIGLGILNDTITELNIGTTYYVRAYATNSLGAAYGEELSVTTPTLPIVTTTSVTDITATTATCGGNVTDDGGATVTARGVCWSTSTNPTISDFHTTDGSGTGSFTSSIIGLEDSTTYYVRAYATNGVGTTYGEEVSFTTPTLPTVNTRVVTNITTTTATSGGSVTQNGGASVTARGVCWSTSHNPTISDSHTTNGTGTGNFTSSITGLTASTTYYVRAYATNLMGTAYGEEVSFTTPLYVDGDPCPGNLTITDIDGNIYNTVMISTQCWMKENLRTTKYADNTAIASGSDTSSTTAYWYYPNNDASNKSTYGLLYNWKAVMHNDSSSSANPSGVQGVCPDGWHVPSDAEWTQLTDYVSSQNRYRCVYYNNFSTHYFIAKALADTMGWASTNSTGTCCPAYMPSSNNATGFSALPAGHYRYGSYYGYGYYANFWSATEGSSTRAYYRTLSSIGGDVTRSVTDTYFGYSVRCVRYADPCVTTTTSITNITTTTATCGGNVTSAGFTAVTARGVCWSTSPSPTISDNHTTDGEGTGSFISNLTGLTRNTTYYVRAYATNSIGTAYGEEVSFTTPIAEAGAPCPGTPTLTDIDGNTYNTVQIGQQCWMKENLRTTKYANNTDIAQGSGTSTTIAYWYYPNNDASNKSTYGLLYNWKAVMGHSYSSRTNPSGVQGICPTGWHVPSDAEWTQLTDYVSSQSQYVCGSDNTYIAKSLASTTGWDNSTTTCGVGDTPANNNATGFGALPAGYYSGGFGTSTTFWSATETSSTNACRRSLAYNHAGVQRSSTNTGDRYSVRCVQGVGIEPTIPTVTTAVVSDITSTTAICGGNVTSDGGATLFARGVCWSTNPNPTISDSHTTDDNGTFSFTSSITGLITNTTYYVRAYATNSVGTAYGDGVIFHTYNDGAPCQGTPTLTDASGNTYNTIWFDSQCWMKENLRTKKYANGTSISQGSSTSSSSTAYWYYPNNNSSNMSTYGLLYNWKAVMRNASASSTAPSGVQGICPTGWHVPSAAEWIQLTDFVSSQNQYVCGSDSTYIAKSLASTTGWNSSTVTCAVGNTPANNNATGFGALPAGYYSGSYSSFGNVAYFWSTTHSGNYVSNRNIANYSTRVISSSGSQNYGYSVRCVKDGEEPTIPTVTTTAVGDITSTSATSGGNVTNDGGATIAARGVCWSTNPNPTISDSYTINGNATGSFTSSITGLTPGPTYYVRAYAINSAGTAYGNEVSFTTTVHDGDPCPGTPALTDASGNTYNTVWIGTQCWMKENLRTKKYANGTTISQGGSSNSTTTAYWYYPNNSSSNMSTYGLLYNWKAVMGSSSSSSANPSGRQGICPTGWHVPSEAEWKQLEMAVGMSQIDADYTGFRGNIAARLCGNTGWQSSAIANGAGNTSAMGRNSSGFSVLPAGSYSGSYNGYGNYAYFWSATESSSTDAWRRYLYYDNAGVNRREDSKSNGYSVRCVKDE